ncbi:hypothetical protein Pst134EA_032193 [Puccinia striiformis f. sp. tritici]|uniref:uncharacterized protein n=1 Tax=Puccinia striiformis f. sp. tritici TaxID=168172 RepID=UPI0020076D9F|nr:uncharacterized protein Pst134EA_032193 [Puccinia striiformis f. sp. tritici]KAH9441821.1 hypothetical protein Pst134EA_032193 [Puccinia striiformis f. sp. tritici]
MYSPKLAEVPRPTALPLKLMCESDTDEGRTYHKLVFGVGNGCDSTETFVCCRPGIDAEELTPDDCTSPFGFP